MITITVAWLLVLTGFVIYEYQCKNVFCNFDGAGAACQHIFWLWVYVSNENFEFTFRYGRFLATVLIPIAAIWFCFGATKWINAGFKSK